MRTKALTLAATAVVIAGLAACTSTNGSSTPPAERAASGPSALANADGVTNITVWHGLGAANGAAFQKAIDDFNAAN